MAEVMPLPITVPVLSRLKGALPLSLLTLVPEFRNEPYRWVTLCRSARVPFSQLLPLKLCRTLRGSFLSSLLLPVP